MDWKQVAPDFSPDGGLRDIYVLDTDTSDWQRVVDWLRTSAWPLSYSVDGAPAELPAEVSEILAPDQEVSHCLSADLEGIALKCHFFSPEEIEFDLLPQEVAGPEQLARLLGFMRELHRLTRKSVLLTYENCQQAPIFRLDPGMAAPVYLPPSAELGAAADAGPCT